ncbi:MAG: transcriptional regulator [Gammaproteobacteria bacterium SG8_47]|nr:MAG: transcriptional regulator [Gammaproteobacteria bacterium SG8_47]
MRLLLVGDDAELVATLRRDLEAGGYAVDVADNGVDGEYLGNEPGYDVAILDLGLPQRSGLQVLHNWRAAGNRLPVIVLTARNQWHERVDGFRAGADDYLGKPFHVEELIARLNALIHRSHQQPAGLLQQGGLSLDEARQRVITRDGREIELTGTEFRLLRYFLLHTGSLLSKSMLAEHVYDFDSDKDSNVIEVYVRRLRQKLGQQVVETRRGQGYVFRGLP